MRIRRETTTRSGGSAHGDGARSTVAPGEYGDRLRSVARVTGWWYLGLAITGLGGALIRGRLSVPGDAGRTVSNLVEHDGLARLGIAADLGVVLTQALVAIWFFLLFRRVHVVAAAITAFGLAGSVVVLGATTFSATALQVALDGGAEAAGQALLLSHLQSAAWLMGGIFFGLWLIPMGWLAWRSGYLPRQLGWLLLAGGAGYVLSTYVHYLLPDTTVLANALILPATVGELWMVGHLLIRGVTPSGVAVVSEGRAEASDA